MWPGGTPHVVVGTLKISLDRHKKIIKKNTPQVERKKKFSIVMLRKATKVHMYL